MRGQHQRRSFLAEKRKEDILAEQATRRKKNTHHVQHTMRLLMLQLTSMPKPKKHLMPIENKSPALPMMARLSASKSQCAGLYLLA